MRFKQIAQWLMNPWQHRDLSLLESYQATFESLQGQRVLYDLLDNCYCTIYEGSDPNGALVHNAQRSVIHAILENLDIAKHPKKYEVVEDKRSPLEQFMEATRNGG